MCSRRTTVVLALCLAAAACRSPHRKTARTGDDPNAGRVVQDVRIDGNRAFDDDDIVEVLAHRPFPRWPSKSYIHYDPLALRVDRKRIEAYYRERGYFSARVTDVTTTPVGKHRVSIRFVVDEGASTRVSARHVRGLSDDQRAIVAPALEATTVRVGNVLDHPGYVLLKQDVKKRLVARGYAHAAVTGRIEVNRDDRTAVVTIEVDPGPLVRYGELVIEGNQRIPASAIAERVAWRTGGVYDPADLELTRRRLTELGVFTSVRIEPRDPRTGEERPAVMAMRVRVTEGKRNELHLGIGAEWDPQRFEVRGRVEYRRHGFLDPLTMLRAAFRPGYVLFADELDREATLEASVGLERIDFVFPRVQGSAQVFAERTATEAYTSFGPGAGASLSRAFWRERIHLAVGWRFIYMLELDPDEVVEDELLVPDPYQLGRFSQDLTLDLRDDRIIPRSGLYASARAEEGGGFAGGNLDYLRLIGELRGYVPLGRRWVVAARARGGRLSFTGDEPITERFYSGGAAHRGFGYRRLSPEIDGVPVGGAGLVETSAELRYDLTTFRGFPLRLVGFVDGGQVEARFADLSASELQWAAGLGLRFDTVVGPLRLDVAYRLNPVDPDAGRYSFQLAIGEAF